LVGLISILTAGSLLLMACQKKDEPIKVGFIGCLTGRSTDIGVAGRDGFMLAINEVNAAGGISGRQVVPVIQDNALDAEKARQAAKALVDENVKFVVGPMMSQMALSVVPILNEARIPLVSPTVSTNKLIGIDDYFFRVYYANSQAAEAMAEYMKKKGLNKVAALYDTRNRAYTEDWLRIFEQNFSVDGRRVISLPFNDSSSTSLHDLVASFVDDKPDGLLILANSIDTALICQQALKLEMTMPKFATGWSYSGKLISYGGKGVEGLIIVQSVDFNKDREEVRHFMTAYRHQFYNDPMFPAAHAYDATRLALQAMKMTEQGQTIKQAILSIKNHPGILQDFSLDKFGDVVNPPIYFMQIDESVFHSL